mmetsp:Transcript_33504/g.69735  ORF Transcript_33504/g.69735 Transcript_33504/m.69735 type:complete len:229 (+) Transcript_33504:185-871(+)
MNRQASLWLFAFIAGWLPNGNENHVNIDQSANHQIQFLLHILQDFQGVTNLLFHLFQIPFDNLSPFHDTSIVLGGCVSIASLVYIIIHLRLQRTQMGGHGRGNGLVFLVRYFRFLLFRLLGGLFLLIFGRVLVFHRLVVCLGRLFRGLIFSGAGRLIVICFIRIHLRSVSTGTVFIGIVIIVFHVNVGCFNLNDASLEEAKCFSDVVWLHVGVTVKSRHCLRQSDHGL